MASRFCNVSPVIISFVFFLLFCPLQSSKFNYTDQPEDKAYNLKHIKALLKKINKHTVKTVQSPDGDIIDCVLSHQQPAFDHPLLKGQKPRDPPKRPGDHISATGEDNFQIWNMSNESCPDGTVPIKRTMEKDIFRKGSIQGFGCGLSCWRPAKRHYGREYAIGRVPGGEYYAAKAIINVWAPQVERRDEFTTSQIWVTAGSLDEDLNAIEAGWEVNPREYGDSSPRLFIYWTADSYKKTGCANLLCSGFVQTSNNIELGGAFSPVSEYDGGQRDLAVHVWKDPRMEGWWLELDNGHVVGYWPFEIFTLLNDGPATEIDIGGEVLYSKISRHTETGMGSGRFAEEGNQRAAYIREIQVAGNNERLIPVSDLEFKVDQPNCYSIKEGDDVDSWGMYFYFGGPGRNSRCP